MSSSVLLLEMAAHLHNFHGFPMAKHHQTFGCSSSATFKRRRSFTKPICPFRLDRTVPAVVVANRTQQQSQQQKKRTPGSSSSTQKKNNSKSLGLLAIYIYGWVIIFHVIKLAVNGLARQVANHDDILFIPLKAVHRLDLAVKPKPWVAAFRMYPLWLMAKLTTRKTHIWVVQFQLGYIYIYIYISYLLVTVPPANWTVYYGSHGQERLDDLSTIWIVTFANCNLQFPPVHVNVPSIFMSIIPPFYELVESHQQKYHHSCWLHCNFWVISSHGFVA